MGKLDFGIYAANEVFVHDRLLVQMAGTIMVNAPVETGT